MFGGSLCSKRFRGVREQRKTEKWDFRCFAHAKNGARAKKRKEGGRERRRFLRSFVPLPHPPLLFFGSRPIFRAGKTQKIPFLCLSLLPNPTETLATQASLVGVAGTCMHAQVQQNFYFILENNPMQIRALIGLNHVSITR